MKKTSDLYVIYQHDEHYTSYIIDDLLFESKHEAEEYSSKINKIDWKAPVKIGMLSEFMGDMIEARQDEGFDLAYSDIAATR